MQIQKIILYTFLTLLSLCFFYDKAELNLCVLFLWLVFISTVFFFYNQQHSLFKGWWIKPSNILILGLLIVNFQYIVDVLVGYKDVSEFYGIKTFVNCCLIASIGHVAFICGYLYYSNKTIRTDLASTTRYRISTKVLLLLQVIFLISWLLTVNVIELITGLTYGTSTQGMSLSSQFEGLFYECTLAILITTIYNRPNNIDKISTFFKQFGLSFWLCVFAYLGIRFFSGDRGPLMYTSLSIIYTYVFITHRKVKLKYVVVLGVVAAFVLVMIGMVRSMDSNLSLSGKVNSALSASNQARFSDETIIVPTEELASSIRCTSIAINDIENNGNSYHNGKFQMFSLLNCIPFAPSILYSYFKIPVTEMSSDFYLTNELYGDYKFSQIGTTVIADFYLDFGVFGVVIGMFLLGLCFYKVDTNICLNKNEIAPILLIIILSYASKSIYIPRDTFLNVLKPTIIIYILFCFNKLLSSKKR